MNSDGGMGETELLAVSELRRRHELQELVGQRPAEPRF